MNQTEQGLDIEALKKDTTFLENIKQLEEECKKEESIAKAYQLLDAKLVLEADEEEVNEIFTFIVNTAFDHLATYLSTHRGFNMDDVEERAIARAIYEHAIQRYSENDAKGAKEMFLVLYHTIENVDLKDAMMIHACCVMAGHSFEAFIDTMVDVEGVNEHDPLAFFIQTFTQPNDILLTMFSKYVQEGKALLQTLEESR
jgi:hypothetical protein